jgi:hypothetical protein
MPLFLSTRQPSCACWAMLPAYRVCGKAPHFDRRRCAHVPGVIAGSLPVLIGAWSLFSQVSAEVGSRPPWEVFYACPTATAPAFLEATQELARSAAATDGAAGDGAEAAPHPAAERLAALAVLARAMQVQMLTLVSCGRNVAHAPSGQGCEQERGVCLPEIYKICFRLRDCCCYNTLETLPATSHCSAQTLLTEHAESGSKLPPSKVASSGNWGSG